jgi:type II secretory pathway component GspD/PulD (secretin)
MRIFTKSILAVAALFCAAPLAAQDLNEMLQTPLDQVLAESSSGDAEGVVSSGKGFEYAQDGKLEYHGNNLDVRDVFATLRVMTKTNIVVSQDVKARFSGDLYGLSFEEAVEIVCLATGLTSTRRGSYLFIENTTMESRTFVLRFSRAEDVKKLIEDMLTEGEKVTASATAETGIQSSDEGAGGDAYASSDVIFVRANATTMRAIEEMVALVDIAPQQVLIEATILTADMLHSEEFGVDISALQSISFMDLNASSNGFNLTHDAISADEMANSVHKAVTNFSGDVSDGGLSFSLFRGDIASFIRALETVTNTTVLAQPKIMALNKQRGEVLLGRRDGFLTTTVTETGTTQQVEYLETGTRLLFRPYIGENGVIRLEIHPEDSEGGLNTLGLPFEETAELTTNILVRSGQTALIGGLYREKKSNVDKQVPGLGDMPLVGKAFGSESDTVHREEVIVLLTATIIDVDGVGKEFGSNDPIVLSDVSAGSPELLGSVYLRTAKALALEGHYGSAMVMLEGSGKADSNSLEVMSVRSRIQRGLVPSFSDEEVDRRILQEMLSEMDSR